jgi:siroheme synthase (precorrin-2 oxidase/ferrochelatase)
MQHYPVFLDLTGRPCFVIGGCAMAEEKVKGLVAAGARVTVISADLTPGLAELAVEAKVDFIARRSGRRRGGATSWSTRSTTSRTATSSRRRSSAAGTSRSPSRPAARRR